MIASAFDLGEKMNNKVVRYVLHQPLWKTFKASKYSTVDLTFSKWKSVKYLNADGKSIHKDVDLVPNDKGGLYMFYVKCHLIEGLTEFPLYIGRAQHTTSQNLRKRVKEYFQLFYKNRERPKITRMIKYWGKELYLAYYVLPNNKQVINIERDIINSTLFEMNDQIPDTKIGQAVKAFNI